MTGPADDRTMRSTTTSVRPAGAVAVAVAVAALTLVACGSGKSGTVTLGVAPTSTAPAPTAPATTLPPTTSPSPTVVPPRPTTTAPEPPDEDLSGFQTDPFRKEHLLAVPPVPVVVGLRSAHHPGFDRVVFDFDGQLPGAVSVRYVDRVTADGSGDPVTVAGRAFLLVRFEEAQAHTDAGMPTIARRPALGGGLTTVREIALAGDYEGYVTVALGVSDKAAFRVIELNNPARVVVDVRSLT